MLDDVDPFVEHPQIITYEHPLDASFKAYYLKVKSAQGGLSSPERADGKPA